MQYLPIPFLVATVALTIQGDLKGQRKQVYVFKPLSTILVLSVALLAMAKSGANATYAWAIGLGLLFSLGGDVALMFMSDKAFLVGVALFLLAHVVYGMCFAIVGGLAGPLWGPAAVLGGIGIAFYAVMYRYLGSMRAPVAIYAVVISIMVWTAVSTHESQAVSPTQSWLVILGAILFYVSDVILAVAQFARPFRYSRLANLAAYYTGQLLIALSAAFALGSAP